MIRAALILSAAFLGTTACTMTPTVTKQRMTLGEANIEGMECRRDKSIGTVMPKTICASKESWAQFDAKALAESEAVFSSQRQAANVGRFNRQ
jgi:hypothetical protein